MLPGTCAAAKGLELALVTVAITGKVDFSAFTPPMSDSIKVGDTVSLTFKTLPADVDRIALGFEVRDGIAPFPICNETLSLSIGGFKAKMGPAPPPKLPTEKTGDTYFALVKGRSVNDGFFISTIVDEPSPFPLVLDGAKTSTTFTGAFSARYKRNTIPSLDMKQAAKKTYSTNGLLSSEFIVNTNFASGVALRATLDSVKITMPK